MAETRSESSFALDQARLRQRLQRAAAGYEQAAFLHREIGQRLLERLELMTLRPTTILEVGCGAGYCTAALLKKYRKARLTVLERVPALVALARRRTPWLRTVHGVVAEPEALPLPAASYDLIFSNLALPWTLDLDRVFTEFQRVLRPGGALLFSTLGPDTLQELRQSWAAADTDPHVQVFFDLHDVGDALLRARLAEPVMDVERLTLTYATLDPFLRDLKALGATNALVDRARGLTGQGRWRALRQAYEHHRRADGLLPVSCEVVYGHAWGTAPSQARATGSAVFPLSQLRRSKPPA